MTIYQTIIANEKRLSKLAHTLAQYTPNGYCILLNGEVGSGKTTFVKHFMSYYNYHHVSSPSFSIAHSYNTNPIIHHLDLYRLETALQNWEFDIDHYLYSKNSITLIEWANRLDASLISKYISISFRHTPPQLNERKINLSLPNSLSKITSLL